MKLLVRLGNRQTKIVDNVTKAERFGDFSQSFVLTEDGKDMTSPDEGKVKMRYWLIHSSDLRKPIRAAGFEVIV